MEKLDFNREWSFYKDSHESEVEILNLPHDAMIYEKRDPECINGKSTGYFPGGKYVYVKEFEVSKNHAGKNIIIEFEGVYQNSQITINGEEVCFHPFGYTGFFINADQYLKFGEKNEIRVVVDNSGEPNTRWYSGSGIYRPVWMYVFEKTHIAIDGIQVKTLTYSPAIIHVKTIANGGEAFVTILYHGKKVAETKGMDVTIDMPDAKLWSEESPNLYECQVKLFENGKLTDEQTTNFGIRVIEWSTKGLFINGKETKLRGACVHHDNGVLGACEFPAAAERRARILKESGFNAIRCAHNPCSKALLDACDKEGIYVMDEFVDMWYEHKNKYDYASVFDDWHERDLAAMVMKDYSHPSVIMYSIGNEVTETGEERGIELTREMSDYVRSMDDSRPVTCGINMSLNVMHFAGMGVYQPGPDEPSHIPQKKNPRALELLMEMSKQREASFESNGNPLDAIAKEAGSGKENGKLVGSEYFNSMMMNMKEQQRKVCRQEIAKVLSEDAYSYLDIAGYNYADGRYYLDQEEYPNRVSVGTETLPQRIYQNWKAVMELPYIIGDFMWTGWDYIGEAGVGAFCYDSVGTKNKEYPFLLAGSGIIDILGNPRPEVWLDKAVFELSDIPYIGVEPVTHSNENRIISAWRYSDAVHSWSWNGLDGRKAEIVVYSNGYKVELILNGQSLGTKQVEECQAHFETKYEAGELLAISYNEQGQELGRDLLTTAGDETVITLKTEKTKLRANGQDLSYIDVLLTDKKGEVKAANDMPLKVTVEGVGSLAGFGSANPCTEESYVGERHETYYGRAQAVVRAGYEKGLIKVIVSADGLEIKEIILQVE